MLKAKIHIFLKPGVLDPQGRAITHSLHALGYSKVKETRVSKFVEIIFDHDDTRKVIDEVRAVCDKLLVNPNTEQYSFVLEKMKS